MITLSAYEWRARLTPGLLAVLPLSVSIVALGLKDVPVVSILAGLLTAAGGTYALSVLVGRAGRSAQTKLWAEQGGAPTLRMLREREEVTNDTQRAIWRRAVASYSAVPLLTAAEESQDSQRADDAISAAIGQCLHLGHPGPQGEPMVAAENAHYGFERNMFGFRWWGRAISVLAIAPLAAALVLGWDLLRPSILAGAVVNVLSLLFWCRFPNSQRANQAGERYARQLLHTVARRYRGGPQGA